MAIQHKWKKAESLFSTTLSASISTGTGETITPASVVGLPTDTEITLTVDRVDTNGNATPAKLERITGTISGGNLTSYTRGTDGTTEQAHASGAVVEYIWNSQDWNDLVDGLLVGHNQDGTHDFATLYDTNGNEQIKLTATASAVNEITITNAATGNAPEISATGGDTNIDLKLKGKGTGSVQLMDGNGNEVLKMGAGTASAVNEVTITNAATGNKPAISATGGDTNIGIEITPKGTGVFTVGGNTFQHGAWTSYTPTLTNVTIGSGTRAGAYAVIGKTVFYRATITLAADSSVSGQIGISLPVTAASTGQATTARFFESGVNSWVGILYFATTTRLDCFVSQVDGTYAGWKSAGTAIPFTWGTSDLISFYITYEAA